MHRLLALFFLAVLIGGAPAIRAAELEIPGLSADSSKYADSLTAKFPSGGTPAARRLAEQKAADAERKRDWAGAVSAWEGRIALGEATAGAWMSLAQDAMHETPPDARHALLAAFQAFELSSDAKAEIAPLLLIADALQALDRPAQAITALEAAQDRAPNDAQIRQSLLNARRATGILVRNLQTEDEADPPRACIKFTTAPQRSDEFHPQDWVRLDPPVSGAAVTREGDEICVSGLPSGQRTAIILRAGMPGEDGLTLVKETRLTAEIGNRHPRVVFDQRMFILPRGQTPAVTMTTVNLSAVKLTLARMTERNTIAFLRGASRLGQQIDTYEAERAGTDFGRVVWQGTAAIQSWQPNRNIRTALPLPQALQDAGPGVYALTAEAGDGTPGNLNPAGSVQMLVRTDLAPTVWRGRDGLTIQVRGYSDVAPRDGVRIQLLSATNDILAETATDDDGVARFAAPLIHGTGSSAPRSLHLFGPNDDFAMLDLEAASFDLSDRGVSGAEHPGPLDAFIWTDRGIYRPGETVQAMAILRDDAGRPADFPAQITVKRPNGQVFMQTTPPRAAEDAIHVPITLSASAATGNWTIELRADPDAEPLATGGFRVDAFAPDRMAVDLGPVPGPLLPGQPFTLPVTARFLYGAAGAGLSGKASIHLTWDTDPFPAVAGYAIGLSGETYAPEAQDVDIPETDGQGRSSIAIKLPRAPDTTHPIKASVTAEVDDPSGHASRGKIDIPVRPSGNLIGIKPAFTDNAIDAGAEAGFDIIAVNPEGARIPLKATLRLIRENPTWRLKFDGGVARYQMAWRDEPLETHEVTIPADGTLHWAKTLDFSRYRVEVMEAGALAATSVRFRAGWVSTDNPDIPDQLDVSADLRTHKPGETARIHVAAPFAGRATLLVLTDRVHSLRNIDVAAGGSDIDVPVGADWGPGAYVVVHLYHAADPNAAKPDDRKPGRAIGLTWVGIDPSLRTIAASIDMPEKLPPRAQAIIPVHAEAGAWVTLAAVDEGILRLTNFESPDPAPHFLGRRRLGLDIRDDWGHLLAPAEGEATELRQGGDTGFALPDIPIRTIVLFAGPVQAGDDGVARIPLDLPDFAGQVRLMAVVWHGDKIGAAHTDVLVRDPLVAEPLLPRFLAPGDDARFAVLMHNLELPPGEASVVVSTGGPLQFSGPPRLVVNLASGTQATPVTMLHATGAGRAVVKLDVTGQVGFTVHRETALTVRPARGSITLVASTELAPGASAPIEPALDRFLPGTAHATVSYGGLVRYDVSGMIQMLYGYRLLCLEQATSKGFPLVFLPDGPMAGPQLGPALQGAIARVLDLQRYDGGFGLWQSNGDAQPWLSAYAIDFLMRAQSAGNAVTEAAIRDGLKYLSDELDTEPSKPEEYASQAYALYDLARAGKNRPGLSRVLAEESDKLPTPLAQAQVAAALAMAHDTPRAEKLFANALDFSGRRFWYFDYGSAFRDQAALVVLLKESGVLPDRLNKLITELPGRDLDPTLVSTQEASWAVAAAATLGRDGRPVQVAVGDLQPPPAPVVMLPILADSIGRNLGSDPVWQTVSVTGVPVVAPPAAHNQMRVSRKFLNLDGTPVDLDHLKQNTVFVLLIEGRADDGQKHQTMLLAGLPAGWEITGRIGTENAPGLPWLNDLTVPDAQPAADDRFAAVFDLPEDRQSFRIAVRLRAVTPGTFELPGIEVADMYRPAIFARQAAGRITVLPVE
jgi:uncharacterized protein YfaS (alpha-2-macroglobulin family)